MIRAPQSASLLRAASAIGFILAPWLVGCGGYETRTLKMRTALDMGSPRTAIQALNEELQVTSDKQLPKDIKGDKALLVLDRASIQQGLAQFDLSKQDFEAADKAIDMLDLARNAGDSIGEYVFSGSSGAYRAPPYEKLMINTLDMLNYLEQHDLNGAKVEARRLAVMAKYYRDSLQKPSSPVLGLGSMLAGFAFEQSGDVDEALRYYDEALAFSGYSTLSDAVVRLAREGSYRSPRITHLVDRSKASKSPGADTPSDSGEVLFVVGYGRVPHKVPKRMPIGLALTYFSNALSPADRAGANSLAAQGLVTWINYPSLAPGRGGYAIPSVRLDEETLPLEEALDVERQVRDEWKNIEDKVVVSAITRLVARVAVGKGIEAAAGRNRALGLLGSLAAQATMTALDKPDTRSWETLPARIAVARVRLPVGEHQVALEARGFRRQQKIKVEPGGWHVVSLMALR